MNVLKTNNLSLEVTLACGLIEVKCKLVHVELGNIIKYRLMRRKELPNPCFEIQAIYRTRRSEIANMEFVLAFAEELVPWCFQVTQKAPIVFVANKKKTLQYIKIADYSKAPIELTIIKGTLAGGTPIRFWNKEAGEGSRDEQITIVRWKES